MPEVIIIDDDPLYREVMSDSIKIYYDKETETYENPAEFLEKYRDNIKEDNLILTDMMMPGMTGTEFLRILRSNGFDGYACIVTASPKEVERDFQYNGTIPNTDVLEKPFNKDQLDEIIDKWMQYISGKQ